MFFIKRRNSKISPLLPLVILICFYYFTTYSVIFSNKISPSHLKLPHISDNDLGLPSSFPLLCLNSVESAHTLEHIFFLLSGSPQNQFLSYHFFLQILHIRVVLIQEKQYFPLPHLTFSDCNQEANTSKKHRKDNTFPGFLRYFFLVSHNEHMDI